MRINEHITLECLTLGKERQRCTVPLIRGHGTLYGVPEIGFRRKPYHVFARPVQLLIHGGLNSSDNVSIFWFWELAIHVATLETIMVDVHLVIPLHLLPRPTMLKAYKESRSDLLKHNFTLPFRSLERETLQRH